MRMNHRFFAMMPTDWAINPPPKAALQAWIVIWTHQDEHNECTVTLDDLGSICGLSRSSVKNALKWLKKDRKIATQSNGRGSTIKVNWNSGKASKQFNGRTGQKSNLQKVKKVTLRRSETCPPEGQKSDPIAPPVLLNNKDISKDISKENNTKSARSRARRTAQKIEAGKLRKKVLEIARRAWEEGSQLPGTNPPKPTALSEKHNTKVRKLIEHLENAEEWDGYEDRDAKLLEYFRRCYFRPWNRQLTSSPDPWKPDRWHWFIDRWTQCVEWAFTSTQMREESQGWAFRFRTTRTDDQRNLLDQILPD